MIGSNLAEQPASTATTTPARDWIKLLAPTLWLLAWAALSVSIWLTLAISIPAAGFLVRLFMIQHDCGHGAFFRRRTTNDWTGRIIGVFTLTPYDVWRRSHATHHATTGNLDHRGIGDIKTLTVTEYQELSFRQRLAYRLYRPLGIWHTDWRYWLSTMGTNAGIAALAGVMIWLVGVGPFLIVHLPIVLLASSIGVWLFYIQHQFPETVWADDPSWEFHEAALHGSSYYDLPFPLRWFTANIGVHHVHHLYSRIPFYRLPQVLRDHPELANASRLTLLESLACARFRLWDESRQKLVTFEDARAG
jgi:omega-6 fatty acid desaturase (delta-12 desaturase)